MVSIFESIMASISVIMILCTLKLVFLPNLKINFIAAWKVLFAKEYLAFYISKPKKIGEPDSEYICYTSGKKATQWCNAYLDKSFYVDPVKVVQDIIDKDLKK